MTQLLSGKVKQWALPEMNQEGGKRWCLNWVSIKVLRICSINKNQRQGVRAGGQGYSTQENRLTKGMRTYEHTLMHSYMFPIMLSAYVNQSFEVRIRNVFSS